MNQSEVYACPNCAQAVQATPQAEAQRVGCPHCDWEFIIPAVDGSTETADELRDLQELERVRQQHLDGLRIQQLIRERRAAYRIRSYLIVAALACAVIGVQLLIAAGQAISRRGPAWRPGAYIPLGLAALMAAHFFLRRTRRLNEEIRRSASAPTGRWCASCRRELPDPQADRCPHCGAPWTPPPPPDFSALGGER